MTFLIIVCLAWLGMASTCLAFSSGRSLFLFPLPHGRTSTNTPAATSYRASLLRYENSPDGTSDNAPASSNQANVWSVLAHTEKWISETLASTETETGNPYSRKEVNYVCETNTDSPMIAANMFKRLREARELGQQHGVSEEDHKMQQGECAVQCLSNDNIIMAHDRQLTFGSLIN